MKYSEMPLEKDDAGIFDRVTPGVIKGKYVGKCIQCGDPTEFIEICTEARMCSEECNKAWYLTYDKQVEEMQEAERCQQLSGTR